MTQIGRMAAMPAQFTAGVFSRLVVWPTASYNTRRFSLATVEIVASTRRTYTRRHSQADLVRIARWVFFSGHGRMRSGSDLRGGSPLVSFDHVIDPHFVTFSSSLYTTFNNPNPNPKVFRFLV